MPTLFITSAFGTYIIKAICWTLVHSLWQGLLLAIAGGLVILFTKRRHPATRYNLLSVLFLFFIIISCYTFIAQFNQHDVLGASSQTQATEHIDQIQTVYYSDNGNYPFRSSINNFSTGFTYYFDKHAPLIVVAWFIILSARLVRMLSGLTYINRIRTRKVNNPAPYWKNRLYELQSLLQINKHIQLLESAIIKVPMAVGWLKPVILLPIGLFNHLPEDELEAILLHELAHIKRRDYFVNLLQSLAETIFFFNPAVLWISSLIREERENCCDDVAIAVTKSKTKFINALVSFQEYNSAGYAMLFAGKKNQLLNRVQRIIYNTNNTLNLIEKTSILSCCLVIVLLSAFIIPQHEKYLAVNKAVITESKPDYSASPSKPEIIDPNELLYSNRKALEKGRLSLKKPVITDKRELLKSSVVKPASYSDHYKPVIQPIDTVPIVKTQTYLNDIKINVNTKLVLRDSFKLNNSIQLAKLESLSALNVNMSDIRIKLARFTTNYNYEYKADSIHVRYKLDSAYKRKISKDTIRLHPEPRAKQEPRAKPELRAKPEAVNNPLADPVIIDLIKEKIIRRFVITNKEDFSYILNNKELIVQGVKQAEALYQKLREKYISPTGETTRSYIWKN